MIFTFRLADEEAMKRFGEDLALALGKGDLVTLHGDLGSGKSTLARALIRTLADNNMLEVPSPTFTLVQNYDDQRLAVTHADLYRISNPEETDELGFDQALEDGVLVVEWPEKAGYLLDEAQFAVWLEQDGTDRTVTVKTAKNAAKRFERTLQIREFLKKNKREKAMRRHLSRDALPCNYETLTLGKTCEILMNAPEMTFADKAEHCYAETVHLAASLTRFIGIDRLLREQGFAAPQIYAADPDAGLLSMEDPGRAGITDDAGQPIEKRYLACAALLAKFHGKKWPRRKTWPDLTINIPAYDKNALHAEAALLLEWYMPHILQTLPDPAMRMAFHACWDPLFDCLQKAETSLVMRDFHSAGIFWRIKYKGNQCIGLIGFQDAVAGPTAYDLVSLGQDACVTISPALEMAITAHYKAMREKNFDKAAFDEAYAITGALRASKILGIFVRFNKRDGKPDCLRHLPRITDYLLRNLKAPVLQPLKACYQQMGIIPHGI